VPYPSEAFGTFNAPFQWMELPESETLVFINTRSTKKQEAPENQKYQKTKSTSPKIRWSSLRGGKLDFLNSNYTRLLASAKRTSCVYADLSKKRINKEIKYLF
jgi:hypothetical protein